MTGPPVLKARRESPRGAGRAVPERRLCRLEGRRAHVPERIVGDRDAEPRTMSPDPETRAPDPERHPHQHEGDDAQGRAPENLSPQRGQERAATRIPVRLTTPAAWRRSRETVRPAIATIANPNPEILGERPGHRDGAETASSLAPACGLVACATRGGDGGGKPRHCPIPRRRWGVGASSSRSAERPSTT